MGGYPHMILSWNQIFVKLIVDFKLNVSNLLQNFASTYNAQPPQLKLNIDHQEAQNKVYGTTQQNRTDKSNIK